MVLSAYNNECKINKLFSLTSYNLSNEPYHLLNQLYHLLNVVLHQCARAVCLQRKIKKNLITQIMKTKQILIPGLLTLVLTSFTMVGCQKETITPANMAATQPSFKHDSIIRVKPLGIDDKKYVPDGAAKGQANE